ncbi:hypothetical protein VTK73DRAFT_1199 [Phialemonium thermophilum]|uniref:Uncharacterized protein n=1 Tax=Phialemonium thermophilum TaxID=223376 RepID=A0ABR3XAT0_9PEZI
MKKEERHGQLTSPDLPILALVKTLSSANPGRELRPTTFQPRQRSDGLLPDHQRNKRSALDRLDPVVPISGEAKASEGIKALNTHSSWIVWTFVAAPKQMTPSLLCYVSTYL